MNEEVRKVVFDYSRQFCGYIKHGERAKLERRAIASPNIIKRMFLLIIEDFHLNLGKQLKGSTISIGGEEKKMKIINDLDATKLRTLAPSHVKQATQDATKFNECLSADLFLMMHKTFFDATVRDELDLPSPTKYEQLFLQICEASHWILATKKMSIGEGLTGHTKDTYNRIEWEADNLGRMNGFTREWFSRLVPYLQDGFIDAGEGMLMGMHNGASTTLGLAAAGYRCPESCNVLVLRSSDDSMTVYSVENAELMGPLIELDRKNLKMLGINLSPDKSFLFDHGFGEYTSWFLDGELVSQYGVETSSMRPQGKNPHSSPMFTP